MAGSRRSTDGKNDVDVLIVGAGPTGLALAVQLQALGISFRIIDKQLERSRESRALTIQPRTLEVLAGTGVTDKLVAAGHRSAQMRLHFGTRINRFGLFDVGLDDTAYPFLLFLSQTETERILAEHLAQDRTRVDRGYELQELEQDDFGVEARIRHISGALERTRASYVVGCDGAHSTVRRKALIDTGGSSSKQAFALADLEVDGLERKAIHSFMSDAGLMYFLPLSNSSGWRLLAMRPRKHAGSDVTLEKLQSLADACTEGKALLRDPEWLSGYSIQSTSAERYREGRVFLAGDAAHVHGPAGAQGMNTGIQDAVNLAWKLALGASGAATPELLDSYDAERSPVGRTVLRFTNRLFKFATSANPLMKLARTQLAPRLIPLAIKSRPLRTAGLRMISELDVNYRRSPIVETGSRIMFRGPKAGDRLPDAPVLRSGQPSTLHAELAGAGFHLLLCGPGWSGRRRQDSPSSYSKHPFAEFPAAAEATSVHRLGIGDAATIKPAADGLVLKRLGLRRHQAALFLVRPDGYIGYRSAGTDLSGVRQYLAKILNTPPEAEEAAIPAKL
jgi:2-polyprenyl-6-methoxyphenol hydroxylase-like FAD-dependent oxidoreductase